VVAGVGDVDLLGDVVDGDAGRTIEARAAVRFAWLARCADREDQLA
jgi:hypothetical protein